MSIELKKKAVKGVMWSAVERFSIQGTRFVLGLILANLLLPADYGLIAMLAIFFAVSQSLIDSGFSSALIRKTNRTETDFSTVFYSNIVISIIIYAILALGAPLIASFYNEPRLINITRVIGLNIVIEAFAIIQRSKLNIALNFKTQAKASIISVLIAGGLGIFLAYQGFGVWALVYQTLARGTVNTIFLWILSKWVPKKEFSYKSFKELFSFGSKLMGAGVLDQIFVRIYSLIIGKIFNADQLGFYTRAEQFRNLPSQNVSGILNRVTYPVLSSLQDQPEKLEKAYKKFIKLAAFIVFPIMLGMMAVSEPMILTLLNEKWIPSIGYLKLLCIAGMFHPIHAINLNILNVKGRSDLFLKLEIIKKILVVIAVASTFSFGINAMIYGQITTSIIALFINTYYTGKFANYGTFNQFKDLLRIIIVAVLMATIILFINSFLNTPYLKLIIGIIVGAICYFLMAKLAKFDELNELKKLFKR